MHHLSPLQKLLWCFRQRQAHPAFWNNCRRPSTAPELSPIEHGQPDGRLVVAGPLDTVLLMGGRIPLFLVLQQEIERVSEFLTLQQNFVYRLLCKPLQKVKSEGRNTNPLAQCFKEGKE